MKDFTIKRLRPYGKAGWQWVIEKNDRDGELLPRQFRRFYRTNREGNGMWVNDRAKLREDEFSLAGLGKQQNVLNKIRRYFDPTFRKDRTPRSPRTVQRQRETPNPCVWKNTFGRGLGVLRKRLKDYEAYGIHVRYDSAERCAQIGNLSEHFFSLLKFDVGYQLWCHRTGRHSVPLRNIDAVIELMEPTFESLELVNKI